MSAHTDPFFDARLLARRNSVSVQEKEFVFEAVLQHTRGAEKQRRFGRLLSTSLRFRAAFALSVLLLFIPIWFVYYQAPGDEFRVKGEGLAPPFFSVFCLDSSGKTQCRKGGKLAFQLRPQYDGLYFSAFARRESDGMVYWYVPNSESGKSISLSGLGEDGLLPYGIRLDDTYAAGRYEVFGFLSNTPIDRHEIRESADRERNDGQSAVRISTVFFNVEK